MWGGDPEKTTWHTHKQNLVCVTCDCKMINWAATYDEVFIVLVMVVAKAILLFSITPFYHMLCDVASIFAVRTFVV